MDNNEMVEKIRKLLRLGGEGSGATQAEAENALGQAQKLMTKYGIDRMTIVSAEIEESRKNRPPEIIEKWYNTKRQRYEWDQYISRILRNCFSVRILWSWEYENVEGFRTRYNGEKVPAHRLKQRLVYVIVGDVLDVEIAVVVIEELAKTMRTLVHRHLKDRGMAAWNAEIAHSYLEGLVHGYTEANERGREEAMLEASKAQQDAYAIVLVDKEKAAEDFIKQNIQTVRARTISGARSGGFDSNSYSSGKAAGRKITLGLKKRLE